MADETRIVRDRQHAIRREMDRRGISLKQVSFDSGIAYNTLRSYFPADGLHDPAVVTAAALFALAHGRALPLDMLSLLLPADVLLVRVPRDVDHDAASHAMFQYLEEKAAAHRPDSPAGPAIAPCEDAGLRTRLAAVPGGAG